jgi:sugar phosphate isomerase/epimerase
MLKLFVHSYGFRHHFSRKSGFDVFTFLDKAAEMGFNGVNLSAFAPDFEWLGGIAPENVRAIRERIERHGLLIDLETGGTEPQHLTATIELAERLGAEHVRTYTHPVPGDHREQMHAAVNDLSIVAPIAARAGVRILVENHEDLPAVQVREILEQLDDPTFGALFDYGNSMLFMEEPLVSLEYLKPWVRSGHMKDHVVLPEIAGKEGPVFLGVPLGEGNLPIVEATLQLAAAGADRVCFENCWSYDAMFRDRRGDATMGVGAFAHCLPPYDVERCLFDAETAERERGLDLVAFERSAINRSVVWLSAACASAGIALACDPSPVA